MTIVCPHCGSTDLLIFTSHYFCNTCTREFYVEIDSKKYFPYSCIFPKRNLEEFYRMRYFTGTEIEGS